MEEKIPEDILQCIDYLAYSFSQSMHSITDSKEDLKQDLILEYLEKKPSGKIKTKGGWYIHFKNILLNKYRVLKIRKGLMEKYIDNKLKLQE